MARTLLLGRKYNLVETLSTRKEVEHTRKCEFTHLVVVDFESTCWKNVRGSPEIIEFPAVLLDMTSGTIVSVFHQYVMPVENPVLSEFCRDLTGIAQNQVDEGVPLKTSLSLFKQWFTSKSETFNVGSVALVSWSDWDFGICLHQECQRKAIPKPDVFNRWIDLRVIYKEHRKLPLRGLKAAVEDMGLVFEGREHSGLLDARNTARLAWKLHLDGKALRITKDIGPHCDR